MSIITRSFAVHVKMMVPKIWQSFTPTDSGLHHYMRHLLSQKGLLGLRGRGCNGGLSSGKFALGSSREVERCKLGNRSDRLGLDSAAGSGGLGNFRRSRAAISDVVLSLRTVVVGVLLHQPRSFGGVLVGQLADLAGLSVDQTLGLFDLLVDDLLVAEVDQWSEVGNGDANQRQTPHRQDLDQPVGRESGDQGLCQSVNVLVMESCCHVPQECG
jgi:hypothetical protein